MLRFEGMDSCARVWLNGREVGVTHGSRLPAEFDVTGLLRTSRNVLAVRVYQFSAGTYLPKVTWSAGGNCGSPRRAAAGGSARRGGPAARASTSCSAPAAWTAPPERWSRSADLPSAGHG
ncbi:sugar-binding domain-containing protein [Streptomyces sp. NPDC054797]